MTSSYPKRNLFIQSFRVRAKLALAYERRDTLLAATLSARIDAMQLQLIPKTSELQVG